MSSRSQQWAGPLGDDMRLAGSNLQGDGVASRHSDGRRQLLLLCCDPKRVRMTSCTGPCCKLLVVPQVSNATGFSAMQDMSIMSSGQSARVLQT